MSSFTNKVRQLEFIVGYHFTQAQRRFAADANTATTELTSNTDIVGIKTKVRKMKKV